MTHYQGFRILLLPKHNNLPKHLLYLHLHILRISSEEGVGAITLTIDTRNIKEITCSGENSWVIQAENTDKGIYQLVKATGGKAETKRSFISETDTLTDTIEITLY